MDTTTDQNPRPLHRHADADRHHDTPTLVYAHTTAGWYFARRARPSPRWYECAPETARLLDELYAPSSPPSLRPPEVTDWAGRTLPITHRRYPRRLLLEYVARLEADLARLSIEKPYQPLDDARRPGRPTR